MEAKSPVKSRLSIGVYLLTCILAVVGLWSIFTGSDRALSATTAQDTIYVRKDGDDHTCNGEFDADASAAPNCAVRTIEQGINIVAVNGTINVRAGQYKENLLIDKPLSLVGSAPVTITSPIGLNQTLITVEADNVTIDGFTLTVNRPSATAGIDARDRNGLTVRNCTIQDTGSRGWFDNPYLFTNVVGIAVLSDDDTPEFVTITNTEVILDSGAYSFYNRGIWLRKAYGVIAGNVIFAFEQDALLQYPYGETTLQNNYLAGGGVNVKEPALGPIELVSNTFAPLADTFTQSLLIKHNYNPVAVNVTANTFTGHSIGIYSGGSHRVTVDGNTFTPAPDATNFAHVVINTAFPSAFGNDSPISVTNAITLTGNVFQKSTATGGVYGTAIAVLNDDSKSAVDFDPLTVGGSPAHANTFEAGLEYNVWLKNNVYNTNPDVQAYWNDWGFSTVGAIEPTLFHQADDGNLAKIDFYSVTLEAVPATTWADGNSVVGITTTITGFVTPGAGDPIAFTTTLGNIEPPVTNTQDHAQATATLTSTITGTATVVAEAGTAVNHVETASVEVEFLAITDLVVTKSNNQATARPGDVLAYLITITNTGIHPANNVVLTDTLPANTTFVAASENGHETFAGSGQVVWPVFSLPNSASTTRLLVVTVNNPLPPGADTITNTATIDSDIDSDPGNNTGYDIDTAIAVPDLTITKDDGGSTPNPGDTLRYTLTYANAGDQIATGVVITETVPDATTFDATNSAPGWSCAHGAAGGTPCMYVVGSLSPGAPSNIDFAVTVLAPFPSGMTHIDNVVTIADDGSNGDDPTPANNTATGTTPVLAGVDLELTKTDGDINADTGQTVVYTLTYTNLGNQIATGVIVSETVPTYTTFDAAASSAGWSCPDGAPEGTACTYTLGQVADVPGALYFAIDLPAALPAGVVSVTNTAAITDDGASGPDTDPGNNTAFDITPVGAASDLAVDVDDNRFDAYPGQHLTYVIRVTNQGTQAATNILITDTLPAELAFAGASNGGSETTGGSGVIVWPPIGSLPSEAFITYTLHATVADSLIAGVDVITNAAAVADDGANGLDADPSNNVATDIDVIHAEPDLHIAKTAASPTALSGSLLDYTLVIGNKGTQNATGVVITDQLPVAASFYTATDGGHESITGTVVWPAVNLVVGESVTRTLTLRTGSPSEGNTLTNTATVADDGSNGSDPNPGDNEDTAVTTIELQSVYLPIVLRHYVVAPDLVVDAISVGNGTIAVTIKNQGLKPVMPGYDFWVDLYINPNPPPTHVNQIWNDLGTYGATWLVFGGALPINPGASRTLTLYDPYYWDVYSNLPSALYPGDVVYAQVDSANATTNYGVVIEDHEMIGGPYNNISHINITTQQPIDPAANTGDGTTPRRPVVPKRP